MGPLEGAEIVTKGVLHMPVKVAEEWLNICGGCEVTILDIGEPLLDLLPQLEFVHIPVLMDAKYHGQTGEKDPHKIEIPDADVGIISGGIRNEKEKLVAEEMRRRCKTVVALGSCACFGGIPAMANMWSVKELCDKVYRGSKSTEKSETPKENLPALWFGTAETIKKTWRPTVPIATFLGPKIRPAMPASPPLK